MELSLSTLAYLFLQLSPFVIVSYFGLSSIFNGDLKGIIYLFGLLISLTLLFIITKVIQPLRPYVSYLFQSYNCTMFTLGGNLLEFIPLSTAIISFTFWYLMFTLIEHDMKEIGVKHGDKPEKAHKIWKNAFPTPYINENWATITFFVLLLVGNLVFNNVDVPNFGIGQCYNSGQHAIALAIAGCLGILWSVIVRNMKTPAFQYFSRYKNNEQCKKASNKQFRCKIYKNGVLQENVSDSPFAISS